MVARAVRQIIVLEQELAGLRPVKRGKKAKPDNIIDVPPQPN